MNNLTLVAMMVLGLAACKASAVQEPSGHAPSELSSSKLGEKLDTAFDAGDLKGLNAVLVLHKGETFVERHYLESDETIYENAKVVQSTPARLHDLRSVTKSLTGLLYGIALDEGLVPGLDAPLVDQFPEYEDLVTNQERRKILVRHALSMTMGTKWNENLPYTDPRNSETAMEMAKDRYRFVLDREIVSEPGTVWNYNGGATAVIAKLIADGAGMSIDEYAQLKIFEPLGIKDFTWIRGSDKEPMAASGLRLNIHDLAKIGTLVLNHGMWDGQQLVSQEWLLASFDEQSRTPFGLRYGYFWWLSPENAPVYWGAGFGNGGQRLFIDSQNQLVIAIFAGNYNKPNNHVMPTRIMTDFVYPAILNN